MLVLAVFSSIIVLIVGQAFKEFTGGLVKLDTIWDSIFIYGWCILYCPNRGLCINCVHFTISD